MNNEIRNHLILQVEAIKKEIASLKEMNPDKRFAERVSRGICEKARIILCQRLPFEPPADCLEWLEICNGIGGGVIENLYGHNTIMRHFAIFDEIYKGWSKLGYFPIGGDGCGGEYYAIPFKKCNETLYPVVYVEGSEPKQELGVCTYIMASAVHIFLKQFLQRIQYQLKCYYDNENNPSDFWWPFDKNLVMQNDPNIASFNITVPWDT